MIHQPGEGKPSDFSFSLFHRFVGVMLLTLRVKMNVRCNGNLKARAEGQQSAREIKWNPVYVNFQQLTQADIPICHQSKRCEKMLAELTIANPRFSFAVFFE